MRKLWLHIGSHKTGTTSLQKALKSSHDKGQLGKVAYVASPGKISINQLVRISGSGRKFKAEIDYRSFKRIFPKEGSCIASTENLFWVFRQRQINKLARILRRQFDEIHIIAYLRRQDSLALSHRKQTVMRAGTAGFYGAEISALPTYKPVLDSYFCFDRKLQLWINAFGRTNLTVRKFEKEALYKNDTVSDFFKLLDLPTPDWAETSNPALSRKKLLTGLYLRSQNVKEGQIKKILRAMEPDEKLTPSRAEAEAFLDHFNDSNRRLAEMLGDKTAPFYFDMDLSRYPEMGNDNVSEAEIEQWIAAHTDPQPC